jgi:hypothetical protein
MGKKGSPQPSLLFVLHALQLGVGALVDDVAGVERGGGLEEQEPAFFIGCGLVLHAARDDYELSFLDPFVVFAKIFVAVMHAEAAFNDEKQFVFIFGMVEDELAFDLVELDGLSVKFGGDVGLPVFGNLGEFFGEVDFGHGNSDEYFIELIASVRGPLV